MLATCVSSKVATLTPAMSVTAVLDTVTLRPSLLADAPWPSTTNNLKVYLLPAVKPLLTVAW